MILEDAENGVTWEARAWLQALAVDSTHSRALPL